MKIGKRLLAIFLAAALLTGCAHVETSDNPVGIGDNSDSVSGSDTAESSEPAVSENTDTHSEAGSDVTSDMTDDVNSEVSESTDKRETSENENSESVSEPSVPVPVNTPAPAAESTPASAAEGTSASTHESTPAPVPAADKPAAQSSTGSTGTDKKPETKPQSSSGAVGNSKLSESGSGTEGTEGKGSYNYGEALQKALIFYELQRSGDIDEKTARCNWRGDSGMNDGADAGLDLTGGLYDAGDNVKFNLPMAYTATMLAWSVYEDKDAYEKSGQLEYALDSIKWINDYLIKCHPSKDVYYYQVGDGNADHSWWGAAEVMHMNRPSYKVDKNSPGSTVTAEAAAALAACALVYKNIDSKYSQECLTHAKQLYELSESTKSDSGYTAANGFYNSWSGFYDELSWAGMWLYIATNDKAYLDKAKTYESQSGGNYKWTLCWDDKWAGAVCLLATQTGEQKYKDKIQKNLDWWTTGTGGEKVTYSPKGLAWLDSWGSLRYATTAAFLAGVYADYKGCPADKVKTYNEFCEKQVNYALGSTGRSFVVGFGVNPPEHPHHRTAQGSWSDNMNEPSNHRHTLYGALVGGPDASDSYTDTVSDYNKNEVACDYNAGFVGALAKLYGKYGGKTLKDFGAIEKVGDEMYVEYTTNAQGNGFTEIKAVVYNTTAWPARSSENLELRYFVDLSELYSAGKSASDVTVSLNYNQGAKYAGIYEWDKAKHIYYISLDFSGADIYPGGQSAYRCEVQFRMSAEGWSADNDPSYKELVGSNGSSLVRAKSIGLYENKKLIYGTEPNGKFTGTVVSENGNGGSSGNNGNSGNNSSNGNSGSSQGSGNNSNSSGNSGNNTQTEQKPTSASGGLSVSLNQQSVSGSGNTVQFALDITNNTGAAIDLSKLEIDYFLTADGNNDLNFWCDYSALTGSSYTALTDSVKGSFSKASGDNCDTKCAVTFDSGSIASGDGLTLQVRITRADWSDFNLGNDYSAGNVEHIYILNNGKAVFGKKP